ncbi:MAG: hypothetical protein H0X37_11305 [Herpetosiphonaceae bacterium]|nr:hypothetical protein [Herpetosiphonaceae bacterium]
MADTQLWWVREVHNFGGFFGGDTVTLTATPAPGGRCDAVKETTLVIDEKALSNVDDRHAIAPEILLGLQLVGERVEQAELVAAREWSVLHTALGDHPPAAPLAGPQIRAYHCSGCGLWVAGTPSAEACRVCGTALADLPLAVMQLDVG